MADIVRVLNVLKRIGVEDHDIRQLARLDRTEIAVEPEMLRRHDRRGAQRVERRPAAADEGPHLPVRRETLFLAVGADGDEHAPVGEQLRGRRALIVDIVFFGRFFPTHRRRLQPPRRRMFRQ